MNELGRILIYSGIFLIILGCLLYFNMLPLGRLPGDFRWKSGTFGVYFPLSSCIIISILLTVILNVFFRR